MFVAMVGAIAGQAPLAAAVDIIGWRLSLFGAAGGAAALAIATWLIVRDRPPGEEIQKEDGSVSTAGGLARVLAGRQNWVIALYGGAMAAPFLAYAGLWGVSHQMQLHGLGRIEAAASNSLMLIGWAVGAPAGGWISDRLGRRRLPMAAAAGLALFGWLILLYTPGLSLAWVRFLLFAIGATTGFINTAMVGSGALLQPGIGYLLDLNWDGVVQDGVRVYALDVFDAALVTLPVCAAVAIAAALLIPAKKNR